MGGLMRMVGDMDGYGMGMSTVKQCEQICLFTIKNMSFIGCHHKTRQLNFGIVWNRTRTARKNICILKKGDVVVTMLCWPKKTSFRIGPSFSHLFWSGPRWSPLRLLQPVLPAHELRRRRRRRPGGAPRRGRLPVPRAEAEIHGRCLAVENRAAMGKNVSNYDTCLSSSDTKYELYSIYI